jgi:Subtilase family
MSEDGHDHGYEPTDGSHQHSRWPELPEEFGETTDSLGKSGVYVYVRGELLVGNEDRREAEAHLRRLYPTLQWTAEDLAPIAELQTSVMRLPAGAPPVPEVIDTLHYDEETSSLSVSPNHVLAWNSHPKFIPAGPPVQVPDQQAAQDVLQAIAQVEATAATGPVEVGVLDTGVIRNSLPAARCTFRDPEDVDILDLDGDGKLDRHAGHGTFVAGVVLHRTRNATVTVRRVEPATVAHDGYTTDQRLAEALRDWRQDPGFRQLRVLNLSISGGTANGAGLTLTRNALDLCRQVSPDLVVVAGAGNDNTNVPTHPANFKDVVAVGAIHDTKPFRRACFSNLGSWVDACAPGVHVISAFLQWQQQIAPYPARPPGCQPADVPGSTTGNVNFDMVAEWRGTSFAAPVVAAWIANRIATGGVSGKQAVDDLKTGAFAGLEPPLPNLGRVVWPPF